MADLLSIGMSGLLAYRRALDTVSNNIANANTAGYSRQRVELVSRAGSAAGYGFIGAGVDVNTVRRLGDGLLSTRLQADASAYSRLQTYSGFASRIDTLLSDKDAGLSRPLQSFFDAANALSQDASSTAARQTLLGNAETLASRLRESQGQLDGLDREINTRLSNTVTEINGLTQSLAELNREIALGYAKSGGQPPNDLLDQRDRLLQDLSARVGISTAAQPDGSMNVYTASGQALVLGTQSTALGTAEDEYGSGRLDITYQNARVTAQLGGGAIGGLLDARRELIDPARAQLGRIAVAITQSVNAQHAQGVDAYGQLGGDFFTPLRGAALAASSNGGSAQIDVGFGDVSQLGDGDYELRFDGAAWSMTDVRSGQSVSLSGSGAPGDPLVGGGLALTINGAAAPGDRYRVQPTAHVAGTMSVAISDPGRIAAASPVGVAASVANTGNASATAPTVADATNPDLLDPVTITFTGPGTYQINGSGSFAHTPGSPISANGWTFNLSGTPAAGDRFEVRATAAGSSGNGNAQALASLGGKGLLDGGRSSILQSHTALVSGAGQRAQQAGLRLDAQAAISQQTVAERESVAGVNLDEEAADLIRYQQAYQAAARVIQVADTLFQTLLQAAGR